MSSFDANDRGQGDLEVELEARPPVVLHNVRSIEIMLITVSDSFHSRLAMTMDPDSDKSESH